MSKSTPSPTFVGKSRKVSAYKDMRKFNATIESNRDLAATHLVITERQRISEDSDKMKDVVVFPRAYEMKGKIHKIAFRDIEMTDRDSGEIRKFSVFNMNVMDFENDNAIFVSTSEKYDTTDVLLNRICSMTNEDAEKYVKFSFGKKSKMVVDDKNQPILLDGKPQWKDETSDSGKTYSKANVIVVDGKVGDNGELKNKYLPLVLWEGETCEDKDLQRYTDLRNTAREIRNGAVVSNYWRNRILEHLEQLGWKRYEVKPTSSSDEVGYTNPIVDQELKSRSTTSSETISTEQSTEQSEDAQDNKTTVVNDTTVGNTTNTKGKDDLPF